MKVHPNQGGNIDPTRRLAPGAAADQSERAAAAKGRAKSDGVELSTRARLFQEADATVQAAPDVREDKVAEVRQQLAAGTYEIDATVIAQRLLEGS